MNRNIYKGLFFFLLACLLFSCGKEFWHPEGGDTSGSSGKNNNPLIGTTWYGSSYGSEKYTIFFKSGNSGELTIDTHSSTSVTTVPFAYEYSDSIVTIYMSGTTETVYISGNSFYLDGTYYTLKN
jgi:hypothetical protein